MTTEQAIAKLFKGKKFHSLKLSATEARKCGLGSLLPRYGNFLILKRKVLEGKARYTYRTITNKTYREKYVVPPHVRRKVGFEGDWQPENVVPIEMLQECAAGFYELFAQKDEIVKPFRKQYKVRKGFLLVTWRHFALDLTPDGKCLLSLLDGRLVFEVPKKLWIVPEVGVLSIDASGEIQVRPFKKKERSKFIAELRQTKKETLRRGLRRVRGWLDANPELA